MDLILSPITSGKSLAIVLGAALAVLRGGARVSRSACHTHIKPKVIVLYPTKELVQEASNLATVFTIGTDVTFAAVHGQTVRQELSSFLVLSLCSKSLY